MPLNVVCLRPEADFLNVGVIPPRALNVQYLSPDDSGLADSLKKARALLIPAVGPALPAVLFDGSGIQLVQVTGAGVDRLDTSALASMGIAVANVPGGSSAAIAEYAVSSVLTLLRRTVWADNELRKGNYA
jgi:phosphoglycerate dehydrogenase-like enzyme